MARRCGTKNGKSTCRKPRANWWRDSIGVDWYGSSGGGAVNPYTLDPYLLLDEDSIIVDFTGLATGETNSYGEVDGSGQVVSVNAITPGSAAVFTPSAIGTGLLFNNTNKGIDVDGTARLVNTLKSLWKYFHYGTDGDINNLDYEMHLFFKPGVVADPEETYGMFGQRPSTIRTGIGASFIDAGSAENRLGFEISSAAAGARVVTTFTNTFLSPNVYQSVCIKVDGSFYSDQRMVQVWKNGNLVTNNYFTTLWTFATSTLSNTDPTEDMNLAAFGNASALMKGTLCGVVFIKKHLSDADNYLFQRRYINHFPDGDDTKYKQINYTYNSTYIFTGGVAQSPVNQNLLVQVASLGIAHGFDLDKKAVYRISLDKGITYGAWIDAVLPAGGFAVQDCSLGFAPDGTLYIWADRHTGVAGSLNEFDHEFGYVTTTDLISGTSISSFSSFNVMAIPDALDSFRVMGRMIAANGVLFKPIYRLNEGSLGAVICQILVNEGNGAGGYDVEDWYYETIDNTQVDAPNETSIVHLYGEHFLVALRLETAPKGWRLYRWNFNTNIKTDLEDTQFGDTFTAASHPLAFSRFILRGQVIIEGIWTQRGTRIPKSIYAKATEIVSSGLSAFKINTKKEWGSARPGTGTTGYNDTVHPDGGLFARFIVYDDFDTPNPEVTLQPWGDVGIDHEATIISELGL